MYIELHCRSAFSFLRGAATPEELIAVCSELKMPAMALLDNDGVYGAARFHLAGKKLKIKAHIGAELTVQSPKSKVQSQQVQAPWDSKAQTYHKVRERKVQDTDRRDDHLTSGCASDALVSKHRAVASTLG